jgi:hypothetical protein
MPRVNFNRLQAERTFSPLPDGEYRCRLRDVEETVTRNGDAMFKLTWEVIQGAHGGRRIFDNLVFSERALKRLKHVCSALGLCVTGEIDLTPEMIQDRECMVTVASEDCIDEAGTTKTRNRVLFEGYRSVEPAIQGEVEDESTGPIPF